MPTDQLAGRGIGTAVKTFEAPADYVQGRGVGATHGEKVNFGVLTQLALTGEPDGAVESFLDRSTTLDLPVTLAALGLDDPTEETLERVAQAATTREPYPETIHNAFGVTWEDVRDAMLAADELGRQATA